ncbi:MAG: DUF4860 domain-containing protein [Oscillospiraceae bacterium]
MKFRSKSKGHMVDVLFTLALFCVFTASALIVVLIGTNVYKTTVSNMQSSFSERTAMAYVAQKVRQNDVENALSVGSVEDQRALVIKEKTDNGVFLTYIYCYNGELCELFTTEDFKPTLESGQPLVPLKDFYVYQNANGSFFVETTTESGEISTMTLAIKTAD